MGIDTNKRSIGFENSMCLRESLCYHCFKVLSCYLFVFVVPIGSHHCFLFLRRQRSTEVFRIEEANTTLEPDVEKVTQIGVGDIVIVGWISYRSIKCLISQWKMTS